MEVKNRNDYVRRRMELSKLLGEDFEKAVIRMYEIEEMSGHEIAEKFAKMGWPINHRTIERIAEKHGIIRSVGESFRLAVKRGRVHFAFKEASEKARKSDIRANGLRYRIFKRDENKCVICGTTAKEMPLEIDHIIPRCKGGLDTEDNLRVLCHQCNMGKQIEESER